MFVADTKIRGKVDSEESYVRLQQDHDQLGQCMADLFSHKYELFHFGKTNQGSTYIINCRAQGVSCRTGKPRGAGILSLDSGGTRTQGVKKVQYLTCLPSTVSVMNIGGRTVVILQLYTMLVRQHLE